MNSCVITYAIIMCIVMWKTCESELNWKELQRMSWRTVIALVIGGFGVGRWQKPMPTEELLSNHSQRRTPPVWMQHIPRWYSKRHGLWPMIYHEWKLIFPGNCLGGRRVAVLSPKWCHCRKWAIFHSSIFEMAWWPISSGSTNGCAPPVECDALMPR